jgi:hypothetical protein
VKLTHTPERNPHWHSLPNGKQGATGCGRRLLRAEIVEQSGADAVLSISCGRCLADAIRRGWLTNDMIVTDLGRSL